MGVLICKICACFYLSNCSCRGDLDMRFGFDLCSEEVAFLRKRKKYVASALKNAFHLQQDLQDYEVCGGGRSWISSAFIYCSRWVVSNMCHMYLLCRYLSIYVKYIGFCCRGLLLQETLVAVFAFFMRVNLEFVRFEVCPSLPYYAATVCMLNTVHSKDFLPCSNFIISWEFKTKISECFL